MNYFVFSEYPFEQYHASGILEENITYIDARCLSKKEIETKWQNEKNTCFFLGTNGLPNLGISSPEQVWFFDAKDEDQNYCFADFNDHEKFEIYSSWDIYKLFRAGRFGGFADWDWEKYMTERVWTKKTNNE